MAKKDEIMHMSDIGYDPINFDVPANLITNILTFFFSEKQQIILGFDHHYYPINKY